MKRTWTYALLALAACLTAPGAAWAQQLTCESRNYQQEICPTGVNITRAWLLVQRSRSPCIEGQTWGFQGNTIWVTQGCEGDFGFQGVAAPAVVAPPVVVPSSPGSTRITCESRNYQQQYCPTGQQISNAWVIDQRSSAPCIQGRSWGFQGGSIWVTEGCAADFGVQGYGGGRPPSYGASMVCESRDYQQNFCPTVRPIGRAWLIAQRSRAECIQGQSWGYGRNGIWVTQGCEGEFGFD